MAVEFSLFLQPRLDVAGPPSKHACAWNMHPWWDSPRPVCHVFPDGLGAFPKHFTKLINI